MANLTLEAAKVTINPVVSPETKKSNTRKGAAMVDRTVLKAKKAKLRRS